MKKSLKTFKNLLIATILIIVASCENESFTESSLDTEIKAITIANNGDKASFVTDLMAGQHYVAGSLTVVSDGTNLNVTYKTNCGDTDTDTDEDQDTFTKRNGGSWTLKATHLYVGECTEIPLNGGGNPKIGKFPYKTEHGDGVNEFTYSIPLSELGECTCIAAHAEVDCGECDNDNEDEDENDEEQDTKTVTSKNDEDDTNYCGEETAWASGEGFSGRSWAMYIQLCVEDDTEEDPDNEEGDT